MSWSEVHPFARNKLAARRQLGVCPQFDTTDYMTVTEHLSFYARVRGVQDIETNVSQVIQAVGLSAYKT
jgi:ATP-binding cassette subfamily A (ABC1) protein 3